MTSHNSKISQFYKFWSFSKISLVLSATTSPNNLVAIVLLGYCLARYGIQLVSHSLIRSGLDIAYDKSSAKQVNLINFCLFQRSV